MIMIFLECSENVTLTLTDVHFPHVSSWQPAGPCACIHTFCWGDRETTSWDVKETLVCTIFKLLYTVFTVYNNMDNGYKVIRYCLFFSSSFLINPCVQSDWLWSSSPSLGPSVWESDGLLCSDSAGVSALSCEKRVGLCLFVSVYLSPLPPTCSLPFSVFPTILWETKV